MANFLDEILLSTREAIRMAKRRDPVLDLKRKIRDNEPARDFRYAVSRLEKGPIRLIAEIKQASPSQGLLRNSFRPGDIAEAYEEEGAAAISVLTEERFFLGNLEHIGLVRERTKLPILRKDFFIDEYQIYQARAFGADAVLFIAALLDKVQLRDFQAVAEGLGMIGLIEVHEEIEVEKALLAGAEFIGINNRDLKTFVTDLDTTFRLEKLIPDDRIVVSESGIGSNPDVIRIDKAGFDAVLIGEVFMKSPDIRSKIRELFGGR